MIKFSGATVKIDQQSSPNHSEDERKVTIVGTPESQWKAQYLIYEKLREESFSKTGMQTELRLTVEIMVPSAQVTKAVLLKRKRSVLELPNFFISGRPHYWPRRGSRP